MPKQKDHTKAAYILAAQSIILIKADLRSADDCVRQVIPKTYARGLDRIIDAIRDLEIELENRAARDHGIDFNPFDPLS